MVCAALCPFGGFVVPLMCCPAGLLGSFLCSAPVGASRCLPGSVALLCAWVGLPGSVLLFVFVWLVSLSVAAFPPPAVGPVWCPGPVFCWYLPLGIWLQL